MPEIQEPLTLAPKETPVQGGSHDSKPYGQTSGTSKNSGATHRTHRFDPEFTQNVVNATGPKTLPRMRKVMASLMTHIHDFARENQITIDEWMAAVEFVSLA